MLFERFKFETVECGLDVDTGKREFSEYVLHLFDTRKVTKRISSPQTTSVYRGISLNPLSILSVCEDNDMTKIVQFKPPNFNIVSCVKDKTVLFCDTVFTSNGNSVIKRVTFESKLRWHLQVGEKEIPLKSYGIDDNFSV